jgi:hypothetical protein
MKWKSNDKGFVPYWRRNVKKFDSGEDAAIERMERGIAEAETSYRE